MGLSFVFAGVFVGYRLVSQNTPIELDTFYGKFSVSEPVIVDTLNHSAMQRLKDINQYGLDYYVFKKEDYSRYNHSVGVFVLAKRFGAGVNEQVASLIHDVSHTAFSHLGDYVYKEIEKEDSYQDKIHSQFICKSGLDKVLAEYGLTVDDVSNKNSEFTVLEQSLPDISADRLEYNLFGGYLENKLSKADITKILDDLRFEDGRWFFVDIDSAKKFADVSLYLTETKWASPDTLARNIVGSKLILRAMEIELISAYDFDFGVDSDLWNKISNSDDESIKKYVYQLNNLDKVYVLGNDKENCDVFVKPKLRATNPWVQVGSGFERLTELDSDYKSEYERLKSKLNAGICLKFNS